MKIRKMRKRIRASKRINFHAELHSLMELRLKLLMARMSSDDKIRVALNALTKFNLPTSISHKNG